MKIKQTFRVEYGIKVFEEISYFIAAKTMREAFDIAEQYMDGKPSLEYIRKIEKLKDCSIINE